MSVAHTSRIRIEKHEGPHRTAHIENFPKLRYSQNFCFK